MGQKLTQPEEIDEILKDFADGDSVAVAPVAKQEYLSKICEQTEVASLRGASISAYRAAYMKSQNFGS